MPIIEMHLAAGRTTEQKRRVMVAMSQAVATALEVSPSTVRILITEHGDDEFSVGGVTLAERNAAKQNEKPQEL
ncbi:MAG: tautomerase family protein [Betaproteobacteria bacterium]|nr:tautomerase family protein [Betaproteobacteria bacterium]